MAEVKAYQKWYDAQESKLGPQLSEGTYSIPLDPGNHIPASIFQHASVQQKLKAMRENESLEASNRRRIPVPEDHPYFKQETIIPYLQSFIDRFEIEEDKYKIVLVDNQPHAVFYKSMKPRLDTGGEFKIHLTFNIKYIRNVLTLLFQRLIKPNTIPLQFKLLNYNPITAIACRAGTPTPQFNGTLA